MVQTSRTDKPFVTIVVPCYNEENVLDNTTSILRQRLDELQKKYKISEHSSILYIDDGSDDKTWEIIQKASRQYENVEGISLARNFGHQNALLAGLMTAKGDALISIDSDLQDDTLIIENMVDEYSSGNEIVYGARKNRENDTTYKRMTAEIFYKLMKTLGSDIIYNHADFRLMGRKSIEVLREHRETNLFLRGMVQRIGFKSTVVYYDRASRFAGKSKYPLNRMIAFALDGITSFSVTPLRIITALGFTVFIFSSLMSIWILALVMFTDRTVPGWTSTVLPIYFIGGVQILSIGILGEYIGKIYNEVKQRPRYVIDKKTHGC